MARHINEFSWKIGGEAGFGIMASGEIFAKTCLRAGLNIFDYSEYPSLIRGGHNSYQVSVSAQPTPAWRRQVNILVALNRETMTAHLDELSPNAAILYDCDAADLLEFDPATIKRPDLHWYPIHFSILAHKTAGSILMRNTVALGATFALLSVDSEFPKAVLTDIFSDKKPAVIASNQAALQAGYEAIDPTASTNFPWDLNPLHHPETKIYVSGNEAIALGALQAGCQFYAAYPMTPATTILSFLVQHGSKYGLLVRQAEDELSVINETIGAAYAGVRAMCGTAGGGFSLMTEAVGLAGMTEVGIVVVEAQRGGPSTGLPTWTEQGDLRQVLHASQGDFLKVVFAPGDVEECFVQTQLAFNIAEQFQTPVLVMTDKYLAESHQGVKPFSTRLPLQRGQVVAKPTEGFRRYVDTETGVSPRTLPGTPQGLFVANSDEHDDGGFTNETAAVRLEQMAKREKKTAAVAAILPKPALIGPKKALLTIVSWGSSKGVVTEARRIAEEQSGLKTNHLHLWLINPFPAEEVKTILAKADMTAIVEGNQSGQLEGWIRQQTGLTIDHHFRQFDGRPFDPARLAAQWHDLVR